LAGDPMLRATGGSTFAPIAIFAYRRPRHLAQVLTSLDACPEYAHSPVFAFSDGAKTSEDKTGVMAVRRLLHSRASTNMTIVEADANRGLARSIITGVTQLCERFGRVIVIEDDLVVHPTTLTWFNAALGRFASATNVLQVSGYQFRVPEFRNRPDGVFLKFASSWTWSTWDRAWRLFDPEAIGWDALQTDPALRQAFDEDNNYPLAAMLTAQMEGRIDSWAIRWRWAAFKADGLTLFPPRSLVTNIGFDATATHNSVGALKKLLSGRPPYLWEGRTPPRLPQEVLFNATDQYAFRRALRRTGAVRNARIKEILAWLGWRRFAR
jgi:hypothetical protein